MAHLKVTDEEMARGYNLPPLHERSLKANTRKNRAKHNKTRTVIDAQTDVDGGILNKRERMEKSISERVIKGTR